MKWEIVDAESWCQIFTDATSRRQCELPKQLAHRLIKSLKELLKRSNELGELNRELNYEDGSFIKAPN